MTPIHFTYKTDKLKVSDQGFLKEYFGSKKIEAYNLGKLVFEMYVTPSRICINDSCYDKRYFMHKLNSSYPENLFDQMILGESLYFDKKEKTKNGFIEKEGDIIYKVTKNSATFIDMKTKFVFSVKKIEKKEK